MNVEKEKLSSGFGVTKIKTDITRAHFQNSPPHDWSHTSKMTKDPV